MQPSYSMADIILETDRLILRTRDDADMPVWLEHLNTPNVMKHLGGPQDIVQIEAAFARNAAWQAQYGHSFWIVQHKASGDMLGMCGLKRFDNKHADMTGQFEIGWRLREDYWRQGIAYEAASAAMAYAFDRLDAPHVIALTSDANVGSWKVMQKLGMTRRPDLDFHDPDYSAEENPTIVYRIEASEWQK